MALARCIHRTLQRRGHASYAYATRSDSTAQSAMLTMPGLLQQDSQLAACDTAPCAASRGSMRFSTATPMSEQHQPRPTAMCRDASTAKLAALCQLSSGVSRPISSFADAMLLAARQKCDNQLISRHAAGASLVQPRRSMCAGAEAQRAPAAYCINVYTGKAAAKPPSRNHWGCDPSAASLHQTLGRKAMAGSADCPETASQIC